jgi:hypothetical protein
MANDTKRKTNKELAEKQAEKAAALRKELHCLIDTLPYRALVAIKPLLKYLAEDQRNV